VGIVRYFPIFRLDGGGVRPYRGNPGWVDEKAEGLEKEFNRITGKPSGDKIPPEDNSSIFKAIVKLLYIAGMVLLIIGVAYLITKIF